MSDAFYIGAIGLQTQQRALDGVASNIANVNTTAFKRTQLRFADVIANRPPANADAAAAVAEAETLAGVVLDGQFLINEPGEIERTGRSMDVAIEGAGFIEVMGPGGQTLLWRGGGMTVNPDGLLATSKGLGLRAGITIPADASEITIGDDGIVRARTSDGTDPVELGQIQLVRIDDPSAVERLDGGLYRVKEGASLPDAQPGEDGAGRIVQGALERSNVVLTDEMVRLMMVQRAYAANAQIVQVADQMMAIANGLRR